MIGNVSDVQKVYNVGSGVYGGVTGAASAGTKAAAMGFKGLSGVGSTLAAGAKGFAKGVDAAGGAGKSVSELGKLGGLTGAEGIVQKGVLKAGGGETLGLVAGKASGAVGGILDIGKNIDSLIDTGGKSAFTRTDAQGKQVKMSTTDDVGEGLTEAGSALDVAAGVTGGFLAPLAAAVSLAGAVTEGVGAILDEKADNKKAGIGSDGKVGAPPPKPGAPISEAFTSLGFVGNQSHNPLAHIS